MSAGGSEPESVRGVAARGHEFATARRAGTARRLGLTDCASRAARQAGRACVVPASEHGAVRARSRAPGSRSMGMVARTPVGAAARVSVSACACAGWYAVMARISMCIACLVPIICDQVPTTYATVYCAARDTLQLSRSSSRSVSAHDRLARDAGSHFLTVVS